MKEFGDEVIGKKRIYLERNTLHRQRVGHLRGLESTSKYGMVSFYRLGNFHMLMSERIIPNYFGEYECVSRSIVSDSLGPCGL